jgi:hypothetical protein
LLHLGWLLAVRFVFGMVKEERVEQVTAQIALLARFLNPCEAGIQILPGEEPGWEKISNLLIGNGRHDWTRTSDLFRVKEAL